MATKKFIIEVEEGITGCDTCPLQVDSECADADRKIESTMVFTNCFRYNLSTLKIKELEAENNDSRTTD